MAEIFGAAAASIALLTQLVQCGIGLHKAVKRIRSSRKDISELANETIIFAGLCEEFVSARAHERGALSGNDLSIRLLDIWIEKTLKGLKTLLKTVKSLRMDPNSSSLEEKIIAYLEWFSSKSAVKRLRAHMTVARQSVEGFSNLILISKLKKELKMLREVLKQPLKRREVENGLGMTIEEKLNLLEKVIGIKHNVHHANARELRASRDRLAQQRRSSFTSGFVPASSDLIQFAFGLESFAEEILPTQHRKNNTFGSEQSIYQGSDIQGSNADASGPNDSASTSPSTSLETAIPEASSTTSASVDIRDTPESNLDRDAAENSNSIFGLTTERTDGKVREWMNDPNGSILSPPKVRTRTISVPPRKIAKVGRHVVELTATRFTLNSHSLFVDNYQHGLSFFQNLVDNPEHLDGLDHALSQGSEDWYGISDWVVRPSEATMRSITT